MKKSGIAGLMALVFVAGFAVAYLLPLKSTGRNATAMSVTQKADVYDRIMKTRTLRCGYAVWPPLIIKDPNTGKFSGAIYDYTEALGKALHLKIEWAEELTWGDFPVALEQGRVDAMCAGVWPSAAYAGQVDFVRPVFYQPIYAYARVDDVRFDNKLTAIDDPSVVVSVMDGDVSAAIAESDFPKAKTLQLPQTANGTELFLGIQTKKADVTFTDPVTADQFMAANPNTIRRVLAKTPIRVFGDTMAIAQGQERFRHLLDSTTEELLSSGQIEKIIVKYERFPGALLRVLPPYQPENAGH